VAYCAANGGLRCCAANPPYEIPHPRAKPMARPFNFSAGPAVLPEEVLKQAGDELLDFRGTGVSVMEMSHRSKEFIAVAERAEAANFSYAPEQSKWKLDPQAAYVHYCSNETIGGVEFQWIPDSGDVPLVCDMSSHFLSRPVDVSKFGIIYAGAQKNAGPAG